MTTLSTAPLSPLLDRLFVEAEAPPAVAIPAEQRAAIISSKTEYRAFYARMKDAYLAVSRETGALLYMLARSTGARSIVEFGTSFGISTLAPCRGAARQWRRTARSLANSSRPRWRGRARISSPAGCRS